jgi:hypothetical protein
LQDVSASADAAASAFATNTLASAEASANAEVVITNECDCMGECDCDCDDEAPACPPTTIHEIPECYDCEEPEPEHPAPCEDDCEEPEHPVIPSHPVIVIKRHPIVIEACHDCDEEEEHEIDIVVILKACIDKDDYSEFIKYATILIIKGEGKKVADICAEYYVIYKKVAIVEAFSKACVEASPKKPVVVTEVVSHALTLDKVFVEKCVIIFKPHFTKIVDECLEAYNGGATAAASAWADLSSKAIEIGHADVVSSALAKSFTTNKSFASASASSLGSYFKAKPQQLCSAFAQASVSLLCMICHVWDVV